MSTKPEGQPGPTPEAPAAPEGAAPAAAEPTPPVVDPAVDAIAKREAAVRESEARIKALTEDSQTLSQVVAALRADPIALLRDMGHDDAAIAKMLAPAAPPAAGPAKPADPVAAKVAELEARVAAADQERQLERIRSQIEKAADLPGIKAMEAFGNVHANWLAEQKRDAHADPLKVAARVESDLKGIWEKLNAVYGAPKAPASNGTPAAGAAKAATTLPQGGGAGVPTDALPLDLDARVAALIQRTA